MDRGDFSIRLRDFLTRHLYLLAVLSILLLSLFALLAMNALRQRLLEQAQVLVTEREARYHFVLVAEQTDSPYWQEVYAGARAAAAEVDAVVELVGPKSFSTDQTAKQIQIATAARLDGIATCVVEMDLTTQAIDLAVQNQIPVVTLEYDAAESLRQCFVGVNSYDLGQTFGQLVTDQNPVGEIIILVSEDPERASLSENQIVAGLQDYLARYPSLTLNSLEINRDSVFSAEQAIRDLLVNDQSAVRAIISLNVGDTLRVVEALVDDGRASSVGVLGYQENPDVLEYIQSGLIQAVIASDPYQIGYDSILALAEIKTNNRTSDYIPSDLVTIDETNVDTYIQEGSR
ncbi:MAG: substrate-binding domain-containing protein [Eubacteriales bacterium]|nr:substrate-binding domain-containing protein [Eubacteriales bacterium]